MTDAHQMEQLSRAYVQAVCALAGCTAARPDPDYGVDLTVRQIDSDGSDFFPTLRNIDLQIKSTTVAEMRSEAVVYDLDARAYQLLRRSTRRVPMFLVLLVLPEAKADWLVQSERQLELRHCAYWLLLRRAPAVPNTSTVRVEIPRRNVFTPDALRQIMKSVAEETDP